MVDERPVDVVPSRVLRMVLVAAQERDVRLSVLNCEDITKRLRFEQTVAEREIQELTRKSIEAGAERRTIDEGEQSLFDLEGLERTHRERAQETQSYGGSVMALRGHIDIQELDKLQRLLGRQNQVLWPFVCADSEHDNPEKVLVRTASPVA